jgi:SAM-dependent methyltransferase
MSSTLHPSANATIANAQAGLDPMLHRIWCCPRCRQDLVYGEASSTSASEVRSIVVDGRRSAPVRAAGSATDDKTGSIGTGEAGTENAVCKGCNATYEIFDGIPDLRLPGESWIDYYEDRELARRFIKETVALTLEQQLAWCFASRNTMTPGDIEIRVRQVLKSVQHLQEQVDDWLGTCFLPGGIALDLGCGPGQLIAAASPRKHAMIGIDVRLLWLLAAKRLITAYGGTPILAAALAENMPLKDGVIDSVVSLDVIEHVADVPAYLSEINRVTKRGGCVALSTPNRYSLAAEPHVGVWGVGWVPRKWQKQFVMWKKGIPYPYTCLLSVPETNQLLQTHTGFSPRFIVPRVAKHEIERFPKYRKTLAQIYNMLAPVSLFRIPLLAIGPFFRLVAVKR